VPHRDSRACPRAHTHRLTRDKGQSGRGDSQEDACRRICYWERPAQCQRLMMIVLFIVLARNKLRIPLERVRTQERCDKISGLYPSCGLTTEPHLSKPLWALLQGVPNILFDTSSPTLSHPPRRPRGTSMRLSAYASLLCGD
jgi:hypothetical protein